jgi:hypothetical protein
MQRKAAEPPNFNPLTPSECVGHMIQNHFNRQFHILGSELALGRSQLFNEF